MAAGPSVMFGSPRQSTIGLLGAPPAPWAAGRTLGVVAVGRYVSEAWFGRQLHPPAYRQVRNGAARPLAGQAPLPRYGQPAPQPRPGLTRPRGIASIVTGTVLLLAVSIPLPFLNVKLLGLIMIVAGLVMARAPQRVFSWLRRNRRVRNEPAGPPAGQALSLSHARPLAGQAPLPRHGQPEPAPQPRPGLTRPRGIASIVTGTVLLLAVSIPLPFLNVKLLGLIMIVAGLVMARAPQRVFSWLRRNRRVRNEPAGPPAGQALSLSHARPLAGQAPLRRHGQPEPAPQPRPGLTRPRGIASIVTGTVLLLAVSIPLPFLNVKLLGLIMIVAGLVMARAPQRVFSWLRRNRRVRNEPAGPPAGQALSLSHARPLAGQAPLRRHGQPEPAPQPRPGLTRPRGIASIVTGTVLLLAVSIPLPFLNVKLLGLIMIVAGLVKSRAPQRVFSWLRRNRRVRNEPAGPPAGQALSLRHARPPAGQAPLPRHRQPEPAPQPRPGLTRPPGIASIVTGTVLLLAVSIPLPFLNVKLLGLIMIVAGLVMARAPQRVFSWLRRNRRVRNEPAGPPAGQALSLSHARPLAGQAPLPRHGQPEPAPQPRTGLTRPRGIASIVTGTVLLLAVSIPLPFLNVKLLGLIMIVAGLVMARAPQRVFSWLRRNRRVRNEPAGPPAGQALSLSHARPLAGQAPLRRHGQPEPAPQPRPGLTRPRGIASIVTGTVLLLAVSIPLPFLNVKLLGLIMIVAGLVMARAPQRVFSWLRRNRRVRNEPAGPPA